MASVHGLEHVERLAAAHLAYHDAIRTHPKRVANQVADRDLALAFDVGWSCFETNEVPLVQLQLDRVLDGHDSLVLGDETRHDIEQGGLACASSAADQDVEPSPHA